MRGGRERSEGASFYARKPKQAIMPEAIAWLLWRIVHVLFALACSVCGTFSRWGRGLYRLMCSCGCEAKEVVDVKKADKMMTVAVVFENQEAMDQDGKIPQLIFWLSLANVGHVTLYDPAGTLKRSQLQLQQTLNTLETEDQKIRCYSDKRVDVAPKLDESLYLREVQFINCPATKSRIIAMEKHEKLTQTEFCSLRRRICEPSDAAFVKDGRMVEMRDVNHMKVELLSLQDGKESLVRAARNVCENAYKLHYAEHHHSKLPTLTEEDINKSLQITGCEGPDPDLLLLFGTTRSLLGFPPWRLRLTEIVHMGTLKDLTANTFVAVLKDFAKKTHRFGR